MSTVVGIAGKRARPGRLERGAGARARHRAQRRRLQRQDVLSARLAELHAIDGLLARAVAVVGAGWVQHAWFTVAASSGARAVTAYDVGLAVARPVTGACLVGAVVQGAGGPATVRSQLVQRTLDLLWHALRGSPDRPVQWCPGPRLRTMAVLELTYWNDAPGRTQGEVVDLLRAARRTVDGQRELCRAEQAELAAEEMSLSPSRTTTGRPSG